jgi:hypothetical protein
MTPNAQELVNSACCPSSPVPSLRQGGEETLSRLQTGARHPTSVSQRDQPRHEGQGGLRRTLKRPTSSTMDCDRAKSMAQHQRAEY